MSEAKKGGGQIAFFPGECYEKFLILSFNLSIQDNFRQWGNGSLAQYNGGRYLFKGVETKISCHYTYQ